MKTQLAIHDPAKAKAYFVDKLAFTTGPVEVDRMIKEGSNINVIDVRYPEDFAKGHIPGAINLPKDKWDTLEGLQKDRINILYCYTQTCHLAATAAIHFAANGYPVMEMEGGFEAWKDADLDVEREAVNRLRRTTDRLLHRH
jgi:rhodanese-related sulfurtransferase